MLSTLRGTSMAGAADAQPHRKVPETPTPIRFWPRLTRHLGRPEKRCGHRRPHPKATRTCRCGGARAGGGRDGRRGPGHRRDPARKGQIRVVPRTITRPAPRCARPSANGPLPSPYWSKECKTTNGCRGSRPIQGSIRSAAIPGSRHWWKSRSRRNVDERIHPRLQSANAAVLKSTSPIAIAEMRRHGCPPDGPQAVHWRAFSSFCYQPPETTASASTTR